jgi:hypothetical protein
MDELPARSQSLYMTSFEGCRKVSDLTLNLCGQRIEVIREELLFYRQPPGIH